MRNTTKLKQILLKYDLALSMEEETLMKLSLIDKATGKIKSFEHASYSQLISKGYGYLLKELKTGPEKSGKKKRRGFEFPGS
ncbi:MAG: hypothetical protein Q8918_01375 [Bacteroidota bacterium]|nr:hypothetical protein [Bacteroidota bacterium]MDP4211039.1 hypothetical protein [Bacteroidota bacterium]MDP4248739.1 hypothetical protein [Bacteroidota bacterium]